MQFHTRNSIFSKLLFIIVKYLPGFVGLGLAFAEKRNTHLKIIYEKLASKHSKVNFFVKLR